MKDTIRLADFIRTLHEQLLDSQQKREDAARLPLFRVEVMELELSVVAKSNEGGKVGFDLHILTGSADQAVAKESVQKVKLVLRPDSQDADVPGLYPRKTRTQ